MTVEVTAHDLPLHCPQPNAPLWSRHPRVFLDVLKTGETVCPYCSANTSSRAKRPRAITEACGGSRLRVADRPSNSRLKAHESSHRRPFLDRRHHHGAAAVCAAACPHPGLQLDALAPRWVAPVLQRMAEIARSSTAPSATANCRSNPAGDWPANWPARLLCDAYVLPNSLKSALVPFMAGIPGASASPANRATA
jgi:uncharacterized Zn-finger protein